MTLRGLQCSEKQTIDNQPLQRSDLFFPQSSLRTDLAIEFDIERGKAKNPKYDITSAARVLQLRLNGNRPQLLQLKLMPAAAAAEAASLAAVTNKTEARACQARFREQTIISCKSDARFLRVPNESLVAISSAVGDCARYKTIAALGEAALKIVNSSVVCLSVWLMAFDLARTVPTCKANKTCKEKLGAHSESKVCALPLRYAGLQEFQDKFQEIVS